MSSARTAALAAAVAVAFGAIMVPTAAAAPQDVPPSPSNGAVFTPPVVVGGLTGVTAVAGGRYTGYALTGS